MDRGCLFCEKEFDAKRGSAKFCSANCRVKWNNRHGKKAKSQFQPIENSIELQTLCNRLLDALNRLNGLNLVQSAEQDQKRAKMGLKIARSYDNWMALRRECKTSEDWSELRGQILAADNLTEKQKYFLTQAPVQM